MPQTFKLQDPGEGIHEAEILDVYVEAGDAVEEGDDVLAIETDKAAIDVPAPFTGVIEEVRVARGDFVEVGDVLLTYTQEGSADEKTSEEAEGEEAERGTERSEQETETEESAEAEPEGEGEKEAAEPKEQYEAKEREAAAPQTDGERPVPASPATRRLARELDIDLREVAPSGPAGRVTADDVRAHAEEAPEEAEAAEAAREAEEAREAEAEAPEEEPARRPARRLVGAESPELPDFSRWGEVERVPLRSVRRTTARRMAQAWTQIPHVTHMDVADVTALEAFRREQQDVVAAEGDGDLSMTVLVVKATVAALKQFPRFNASLDPEAEEIILKHYYHLGLAVDTERGLLVPVLRDVDRKSILELAAAFSEVVERARAGDLAREDMRGGTFTVTNPGPLGGTAFTPLINVPQVAVLGMAQARWEPVVRGDPPDDAEIVPRLRLPLCLGFDHRVNDGADAARFVDTLIGYLEDPDTFLLTA